ncbi:MAG: hypothetical protein WBE79_08445 [Candidatus Cybelea sp.]
MSSLVAALLLGIVAGLRTLTAPAVLLLLRGGGWASYVLVVGALLEDAGDLNPKTPPRTAPVGLIARLLSGGFCGWWLTVPTGASVVMGVLLGACGALIGAYGGLSARRLATSVIGRVPAALLEDVVAIAAAIAIVMHAGPPIVTP